MASTLTFEIEYIILSFDQSFARRQRNPESPDDVASRLPDHARSTVIPKRDFQLGIINMEIFVGSYFECKVVSVPNVEQALEHVLSEQDLRAVCTALAELFAANGIVESLVRSLEESRHSFLWSSSEHLSLLRNDSITSIDIEALGVPMSTRGLGDNRPARKLLTTSTPNISTEECPTIVVDPSETVIYTFQKRLADLLLERYFEVEKALAAAQEMTERKRIDCLQRARSILSIINWKILSSVHYVLDVLLGETRSSDEYLRYLLARIRLGFVELGFWETVTVQDKIETGALEKTCSVHH